MKFKLFVLLGAMLMAAPVFAADKKPHEMPTPTPEQRAKLADMHQKMADCLKSDKPMSDCREQMMKDCKDATGNECPMMGAHMMKDKHHGKHEKSSTRPPSPMPESK